MAPEITSIEYYNHLLYVTWTYGGDGTDLSHSRMLHWMVIAEGKKKIKKSVSMTGESVILFVFFCLIDDFVLQCLSTLVNQLELFLCVSTLEHSSCQDRQWVECFHCNPTKNTVNLGENLGTAY